MELLLFKIYSCMMSFPGHSSLSSDKAVICLLLDRKMWRIAAWLQYTKISYSFKVTVHQIFEVFTYWTIVAFWLTPPTVFTSTSLGYEVTQHIHVLFGDYSTPMFGRVITHQTQPSSLHVLLPCGGGVSCSDFYAFIIKETTFVTFYLLPYT